MSKIKITSSAVVYLMNTSRSLSSNERLKLLKQIGKSNGIVTVADLKSIADKGTSVDGDGSRQNMDTINDFDESTVEMEIPLAKRDIVINDPAQVPYVLKELFQRDGKLASMSATKLLDFLQIINNALASGDRAMSGQYIYDLMTDNLRQEKRRQPLPETKVLDVGPAAQETPQQKPERPLSPSEIKELENLTEMDEDGVFAPLSQKVDSAAPTKVKPQPPAQQNEPPLSLR